MPEVGKCLGCGLPTSRGPGTATWGLCAGCAHDEVRVESYAQQQKAYRSQMVRWGYVQRAAGFQKRCVACSKFRAPSGFYKASPTCRECTVAEAERRRLSSYLRMHPDSATPQLLALKREQLATQQLAKQIKRAINETLSNKP